VISPIGMEAAVECIHCHVVMTSWSAPGSPIRYWQCPFCARTHSSPYGEVFRRRAGARIVEGRAPRAAVPSAVPMASQEDARWARVRQSAARWFARLEADEERNGRHRAAGVPEADPADVVEVAPARARGTRRG
jgi:hypothetical protein